MAIERYVVNLQSGLFQTWWAGLYEVLNMSWTLFSKNIRSFSGWQPSNGGKLVLSWEQSRLRLILIIILLSISISINIIQYYNYSNT